MVWDTMLLLVCKRSFIISSEICKKVAGGRRLEWVRLKTGVSRPHWVNISAVFLQATRNPSAKMIGFLKSAERESFVDFSDVCGGRPNFHASGPLPGKKWFEGFEGRKVDPYRK
jgi:hypothetical protein